MGSLNKIYGAVARGKHVNRYEIEIELFGLDGRIQGR